MDAALLRPQAVGQIMAMVGSIAAAWTAALIMVGSLGGLMIDRQTLALIGDACQVMVVPENRFYDCTGNLNGNIAARERQSQAPQPREWNPSP